MGLYPTCLCSYENVKSGHRGGDAQRADNMKTQGKMTAEKTTRKASGARTAAEGTNPAPTHGLGLPASELGDQTFLLSKLPNSWFFVTAALRNEYRYFPCGPVAKTPPSNAWGQSVSLIPGWGA